MSSEVATYVYCVLRSTTPPDVGSAPEGLPRTGPLRALGVTEDLWLIVADAPLDQYGEERIAAALQDLDWVGVCAVAHEAVVEGMLETGDVLPLKLFTLFDDDARAGADIRGRRESIAAAMDHVSGCREWTVRFAWSGRTPEREQPPRPQSDAKGAGRDFLRRKSEALNVAKIGRELAMAEAEGAITALARICRDVARNEVREATGTRLLADVACLVPRAEEARFQTRVEEIGGEMERRGIEVGMTGPWPVHHFAGGPR